MEQRSPRAEGAAGVPTWGLGADPPVGADLGHQPVCGRKEGPRLQARPRRGNTQRHRCCAAGRGVWAEFRGTGVHVGDRQTTGLRRACGAQVEGPGTEQPRGWGDEGSPRQPRPASQPPAASGRSQRFQNRGFNMRSRRLGPSEQYLGLRWGRGALHRQNPLFHLKKESKVKVAKQRSDMFHKFTGMTCPVPHVGTARVPRSTGSDVGGPQSFCPTCEAEHARPTGPQSARPPSSAPALGHPGASRNTHWMSHHES